MLATVDLFYPIAT